MAEKREENAVGGDEGGGRLVWLLAPVWHPWPRGVRMARAVRLACEAGRESFLAGRMDKRFYASASSPMQGLIAGQSTVST